jgi:hypothetical protein
MPEPVILKTRYLELHYSCVMPKPRAFTSGARTCPEHREGKSNGDLARSATAPQRRAHSYFLKFPPITVRSSSARLRTTSFWK